MVHTRLLSSFSSLLGAALLTSSAFSAVDFVHEVMPILKEHCAECHTGEKKKGGLSINTREDLLAGSENGEVVVPGDSSKSLFYLLAASESDDEWMPPKGPRVPKEKIAILKKWIEEGVAWEAGIRLGESAWEPPLKPREVALPPAQKGRNHPIDRILDADLAKQGKALPAASSDAEFLRRASLDLTGLLPSPAELERFLADTSPDKRSAHIDALLADDLAYADHWLTTWNDLLRNDYTGTGFITKGRRQITTWLYAALRENKPYDEMVRELVAPPSDESRGFLDGIRWRGDVNSSQTTEMQFAQNASQVFLGINLKCASCHDSFIDRWTLQEAYDFAAIGAAAELELHRCDKPNGQKAVPRWLFPELGNIDPKAPREKRLEQLAGLITHPENGRFSRTIVNRLWERLMGRGIVHPVDAMHTEPWNEDLLDHLAVQFAKDGYDLRKFLRYVSTSQAYQAQAASLRKAPTEKDGWSGPLPKRMSAEQFLDTLWQVTGTAPSKAAANVDRTIKKNSDPKKKIVANWIWHQGEPGTKSSIRKTLKLKAKPAKATLVATCDNAFVFKVNGKQVAKSSDWQSPVTVDIAAHLKPGENLLTVDAEMHGGACGFVAHLSLEGKGLAVNAVATDASWEAKPPAGPGDWAAAKVIAAHGGAPWGSVLTENSASAPLRASLLANDFLMRSMGRPHREQVVTTRPAELTTLQAIDLANGDVLAAHLKKGAQSVAAEGRKPAELVDHTYRFALSRPPTDEEKQILIPLLSETPTALQVEDLLWLVFMHPDFQIIR